MINKSIITFNIYAYCVVLSGYIKHRCSYYFLKNNHMDRFPHPAEAVRLVRRVVDTEALIHFVPAVRVVAVADECHRVAKQRDPPCDQKA